MTPGLLLIASKPDSRMDLSYATDLEAYAVTCGSLFAGDETRH